MHVWPYIRYVHHNDGAVRQQEIHYGLPLCINGSNRKYRRPSGSNQDVSGLPCRLTLRAELSPL